MADVSIDTLITDVRKFVLKAPKHTIIDAYRRAVRDWCGQTRWLRQNQPGTLEADVQVYALGPDPLMEIVDVPAASIDITIAGRTQTFGMKPSDPTTFDPNAAASQPYTYAYLPEGSIAFYYVPKQAYVVNLTLALQPTVNCETIDDSMLRKWFKVFEAGALAYLLMLPEAWKDEKLAGLKMAEFAAGVNNGKTDVVRGYQSGTVMVRKRAWIV